MQQLNTLFEILKNASEFGFCERFFKVDNEKLKSSSSTKQYSKEEVFSVLLIPCPIDKSTICFFKTPTNEKGVFIEYWESRNNF